MKTYGLIGFPLNHSFSKKYFTNKFKFENIDAKYINIEIESLYCFKDLIIKNNLSGINITIPYKSKVLDYLDFIDNTAKTIGAVNTIKIVDDKLYGYNTDIIGFEKSILPLLDNRKDLLFLEMEVLQKLYNLFLKNLK